jgi:peptidoglycan/xylan/chitin deacetylase (PgdA/CDA1 family)
MKRIFFTLILLSALALACNLSSPARKPLTTPTEIKVTPVETVTLPAAKTNEVINGYITFAINVHDWVHPDESAAILIKLVDLFEKYGVRGDFYFTPEITRALAEKYPQAVQRLKESEMTISYHVRAPHPFYNGFESPLEGLNKNDYQQALLDYETYALDLETGGLDRSRPGGYTYVARIFGRKPVVAPGHPVYASLGGQMTIRYHEEGTKIEQPFEYAYGMLVRPSDFSVTRNTIVDGTQNFWWNQMSSADAAEYLPLRILELYRSAWDSGKHPRPPFITVLIHENNFYRSGPEGWTSIYYSIDAGKRGEPLSPPFNLDAPDPSQERRESEKTAIWQAYEDLVAYAAAHLKVVTSEDILELAGK